MSRKIDPKRHWTYLRIFKYPYFVCVCGPRCSSFQFYVLCFFFICLSSSCILYPTCMCLWNVHCWLPIWFSLMLTYICLRVCSVRVTALQLCLTIPRVCILVCLVIRWSLCTHNSLSLVCQMISSGIILAGN